MSDFTTRVQIIIVPTIGQRLSLRGAKATVVSTNGTILRAPLAGAGEANAACDRAFLAADEQHASDEVGGVWQLHRSEAAGDVNGADERIANLDETTAHWMRLSANMDGSFRVQNGRTGVWKHYDSR